MQISEYDGRGTSRDYAESSGKTAAAHVTDIPRLFSIYFATCKKRRISVIFLNTTRLSLLNNYRLIIGCLLSQ